MSLPHNCVLAEFREYLKDPSIAVAVATIKALTGVIKRSKASTMMELEISLRAAADQLKSAHGSTQVSKISLTAGCELFLRYVTRCFLEFDDFEVCKSQLLDRGEVFANTSLKSRNTIAEIGHHFVRDGMIVLTHGSSRVTTALLIRVAKTKNFSVIMTEARPTDAGYKAAKMLLSAGIPVTMIVDAAIGYIMEKVDLVIVGAEGVVESGGIVSKIGTFSCAMVAKAMNKPFYVAAESYKFARLYPVNQYELPENLDDASLMKPSRGEAPEGLKVVTPSSDYTPPEYITLLFTDLGVLTPSAVSDELIKLYQ